jgi:hypothetical protein
LSFMPCLRHSTYSFSRGASAIGIGLLPVLCLLKHVLC